LKPALYRFFSESRFATLYAQMGGSVLSVRKRVRPGRAIDLEPVLCLDHKRSAGSFIWRFKRLKNCETGDRRQEVSAGRIELQPDKFSSPN